MLAPEDKKLAEEFGIDQLEESIVVDLLGEYYETLNLRVAMAVEDKLSDEQLEAFEKVHDTGDDAAIEAWLKQAVPDYDSIVANEAATVKADIKQTIKSVNDK